MPGKAAFSLYFLVLMLAGAAAAIGGDVPLKAALLGETIDLDTGQTTNMGGVSLAFNSVDNEYRVVWFDSRIAGQNDVYAQRVSPEGLLLGGNVEIISGPSSQTDTSVAYTPVTNQYFITWRNQSGGPGSPGFNHAFGGLVSATGGLLGPEIDVSNGGLEATLAYNSTDNQFFLEARNFAGGGVAGIRGQRISGAGTLIGSGISISTSGAPSGQVAYSRNSNQYLATWRDQSQEKLKGRVVNADGSLAGPAFVISDLFPESGLAASLDFDPENDRYLVVFSEFCCGGVYGQFVSSAGSLIGSNFTIVPSSTDRLSPFVAYDGVNRTFLLVWKNSNTKAIKAQLLLPDGTSSGEAVSVVHPGSPGTTVRIAANTTEGGFLLAWADHDYNGNQHDILAQRIGVVPDVLWADVETLSAATGGTVNFTLDATPLNGFRNYLMLGSISGIEPGTPLPGGQANLPLNWDVFTEFVISLLNSPFFTGFLGTLDASGLGTAQMNLPPLPHAAVGIEMSFAYALNGPWDFASFTVQVEVVP
jgi:hypothetical protein